MDMPKVTPKEDEIDRYLRELMDFSRRAEPTKPATEASPAPDQLPEDTGIADEQRGKPPLPEETIPSPAVGEPGYVGYLRVFVTAGNEAEPLRDARVAVVRPGAKGEVLYATAVTDQNGLTPVLPLPSVSPELSQHPGDISPYVPYTIRVNADGYQPRVFENVPIYGGDSLTQSAAMLPISPGGDDTPRVVREGAPENLR